MSADHTPPPAHAPIQAQAQPQAQPQAQTPNQPARPPSPARWAAAGVLGGASAVGMLWAVFGRAPVPLEPLPPADITYYAEPDLSPADPAVVDTPAKTAAPAPARAAIDDQPMMLASSAPVIEAPPASAPTPTPRREPVEAEPAESLPDRATDEAINQPPQPASPATLTDRLNINTATKEQLELLPRIGPTLAQRIIDFRESEGPIRSLTHLTDVKGIGVRTAETLDPYIRFD